MNQFRYKGNTKDMVEILLIRHGETDYNKNRRFAGVTNIGLNDCGEKQAFHLREKLRNEKIDIVYSSDLQRCIDTVRIINFNSEVRYSKNLREVNLGIWEGLTYDEIKMNYPDEEARWKEDWIHFAAPGGESFFKMSKRVIGEFEEIKTNYNKVAVVTHGGCICIILAHYIIGSLDGCLRFYIDNGTITRLCFNNNFAFLKSLNEK